MMYAVKKQPLSLTDLRRRRDRHGAIFVTALGIIVVISGLVLVFAQEMRTESVASGNRLSYIQADAVEQGAEKYVQAMIESNPGDAVTITSAPAEAVPVGGGYFWILSPNPDSDQDYGYGITDEASKLNLNPITVATSGTATVDALLLYQTPWLPGISESAAESICDWVDQDTDPNPDGGEDEYYGFLQEPYQTKNCALESVEELLMVRDVTPQMLFGMDLNRDGVVSQGEINAAAAANNNSTSANATAMTTAVNGNSRGFFNYVTCYTSEPNTQIDGTARINVATQGYVNTTNTQALSGNQLYQTLSASISAGRVVQMLNAMDQVVPKPPPNGPPPNNATRTFPTLYSFYKATNMTDAEFATVADKLTTRGVTQSMRNVVNVNTASKPVLKCLLASIESDSTADSDADAIIAKRQTSDLSSMAWFFTSLSDQLLRTRALGQRITGRSFQYSADIVAVSGDGRAFKRVRIVVDDQAAAATTPGLSKIVYRRDLTSLGWPLPAEVRASLRSGQMLVGRNSGGMIMSRSTVH
jgi:type II secretory pathway component PulK